MNVQVPARRCPCLACRMRSASWMGVLSRRGDENPVSPGSREVLLNQAVLGSSSCRAAGWPRGSEYLYREPSPFALHDGLKRQRAAFIVSPHRSASIAPLQTLSIARQVESSRWCAQLCFCRCWRPSPGSLPVAPARRRKSSPAPTSSSLRMTR